MKQLPLGITLPKTATFASFYGRRNAQVVAAMRHGLEGCESRSIYLHGPSGSGKTHLLHAACNAVADRELHPFYLSFSLRESLSPEMLSGLERLDFIALDDLQHIAGDAYWEEELFGLFNALFDTGKPLLLSANTSPESLGIRLPDLRSRIGWSTVFRLEELDDAEKIGALQTQARLRGLELNEEAGRYLLSRVRRDMGSLLELLDRLDTAALIAQRRITVPFIREILNS